MTMMIWMFDMSVICPYCNHVMPNRINIYGTICLQCSAYIAADRQPYVVEENEKLILQQQNFLRKHLREIILGEKHGNKVE